MTDAPLPSYSIKPIIGLDLGKFNFANFRIDRRIHNFGEGNFCVARRGKLEPSSFSGARCGSFKNGLHQRNSLFITKFEAMVPRQNLSSYLCLSY